MWKLNIIKDKFENMYNQYGEAVVLLREATCDQPWGPTTEELKKLCQVSFRYDQFYDLMKAIWDRLKNVKSSWRNIYKTCLVIDYLVKNGSERALEDINQNSYILENLKSRDYLDDDRKEHRISICHRVSEILKIISDSDLVESERKKAKDYNDRMKNTSSFGSENYDHSLESHDMFNINSTNSKGNNSWNSSKNDKYHKLSGKFPSNSEIKEVQVGDNKNILKAENVVDLMDFTPIKEQKETSAFDIFDPLQNPEQSIVSNTQFSQGQFDQTQELFTDISVINSNNFSMQPNYQTFQMGYHQNEEKNSNLPMTQNQINMQNGFMNINMNKTYHGFTQNIQQNFKTQTMSSYSNQPKSMEAKGIDFLLSENLNTFERGNIFSANSTGSFYRENK